MNILYVAQCGLPNTAPGIRIYNIARILRKLGHEVTFLCRETDKQEIIYYDGFRYLFEARSSSENQLTKRIHHGIDSVFANETIKRIKKELKNGKYGALIIYNDSSGLTNRVLRLKDNFNIYADVTEWYSYGLRNGIFGNFYAFQNSMRIRYTDKKLDGIIAISPYLRTYYKSINASVIEIPPISAVFNSAISDYDYRDDNCVKLIYCGAPSTKDLLAETVIALSRVNHSGIKIELTLVGISKSECAKLFKMIPKGLKAVARIPHEEVYQYYEEADFSILFRRPQRYAKAGYSTKFSESLSLGIPVICNEIGGADTEIIDGYNGFKIQEYSVDSIEKLLKNICNLKKEQIRGMKYHALEFANKKYRLDSYVEEMRRFLHE